MQQSIELDFENLRGHQKKVFDQHFLKPCNF